MTQTREVRGVATEIKHLPDGQTHVIYHRTIVVYINARERRVMLNSGGWKTATTKTRMNQASNQFRLGYHVFSRKKTWYVRLPNGCTELFHDFITFPLPRTQS